jgi:hypothetical protein
MEALSNVNTTATSSEHLFLEKCDKFDSILQSNNPQLDYLILQIEQLKIGEIYMQIMQIVNSGW